MFIIHWANDEIKWNKTISATRFFKESFLARLHCHRHRVWGSSCSWVMTSDGCITGAVKVKGNVPVGRKVRGKVIRLVWEKCFTIGPRRAKWLSYEDRLFAITVHLFQPPPPPPPVGQDLVIEVARWLSTGCCCFSTCLCSFSSVLFLLFPSPFPSASFLGRGSESLHSPTSTNTPEFSCSVLSTLYFLLLPVWWKQLFASQLPTKLPFL